MKQIIKLFTQTLCPFPQSIRTMHSPPSGKVSEQLQVQSSASGLSRRHLYVYNKGLI